MSYLAKGRKEDLKCLAEELGLETNSKMIVVDLKNLIINSDSYDEEFTKTLLETIITTRKETEDNERESAKQLAEAEKLRLENEVKKQQMEYELRKLELESQNNVNSQPITIENVASFSHELIRLMPKFKVKEDDIVLYLSLFERQAKRTKVDQKDWVSVLLTLLPSEIVQLIARESEESFEDYDYIKSLLMKRFKMSPESFRRKFVQHQRSPEKSWRDFTFELTNYFQEWIDGLKIKDFEALKNLMITDQIKRRVPTEVREHFLDDWAKFVSPYQLADKLDDYDCIRSSQKKSVMKDKPVDKHYPKTPPVDRTNQNKFQHTNQNYQKHDQHHTKAFHRQMPRKSCYSCGDEGHFANLCPKNPNKKNPKSAAQGNLVQASPSEKESTTYKENKSPALTARINTPVTTPIDYENSMDELKLVKIKCGAQVLTGIIDTGAQISVVREELVSNVESEGEGRIEISSAFGESETTSLRIFEMQIDDGLHAKVPISCAVSRKLVSDLLLSMTAYEALSENVELHDSETIVDNQESCFSSVSANEIKNSHEHSRLSHEIIPTELNICSMNVTSEGQSNKTSENKNEFIQWQKEDQSLKHAWDLGENGRNSFKIQDGLLIHNESMFGENTDQVVLPECKINGLRVDQDISQEPSLQKEELSSCENDHSLLHKSESLVLHEPSDLMTSSDFIKAESSMQISCDVENKTCHFLKNDNAKEDDIIIIQTIHSIVDNVTNNWTSSVDLCADKSLHSNSETENKIIHIPENVMVESTSENHSAKQVISLDGNCIQCNHSNDDSCSSISVSPQIKNIVPLLYSDTSKMISDTDAKNAESELLKIPDDELRKKLSEENSSVSITSESVKNNCTDLVSDCLEKEPFIIPTENIGVSVSVSLDCNNDIVDCSVTLPKNSKKDVNNVNSESLCGNSVLSNSVNVSNVESSQVPNLDSSSSQLSCENSSLGNTICTSVTRKRKRWLHQAMLDCNSYDKPLIIDPGGLEGYSFDSIYLCPTSHGEMGSPGGIDDTITTLKKRRLSRESVESPLSPNTLSLEDPVNASLNSIKNLLKFEDELEESDHQSFLLRNGTSKLPTIPKEKTCKKLTPCQQRWSTIEREAFCVIEALKKFDTWIFGAQVQIISDHNPLTYLTHSAPHGAKLSRWALALQRYNMTVTYRKGSSHGNADALSRLSVTLS